MSPLDDMPKSEVSIVSADGNSIQKTRALITKNTVFIDDTNIIISVGDEIRRTLPNGQEETFRVDDPVYYEDTFGIGAHYQVKISRKGTFPPHSGGNYNISLSGANARVNISSVDNSTNHNSSETFFGQISSKIDQLEADASLRAELRELVARMESEQGTPHFLATYQKFVASLGDHVTVLGPFLPALTAFIAS